MHPQDDCCSSENEMNFTHSARVSSSHQCKRSNFKTVALLISVSVNSQLEQGRQQDRCWDLCSYMASLHNSYHNPDNDNRVRPSKELEKQSNVADVRCTCTLLSLTFPTKQYSEPEHKAMLAGHLKMHLQSEIYLKLVNWSPPIVKQNKDRYFPLIKGQCVSATPA